MILPPSYSLRPLDVEFMRCLHHCVNIVPVIAKADTLTIEERVAFKKRVSRRVHCTAIEFDCLYDSPNRFVKTSSTMGSTSTQQPMVQKMRRTQPPLQRLRCSVLLYTTVLVLHARVCVNCLYVSNV